MSEPGIVEAPPFHGRVTALRARMHAASAPWRFALAIPARNEEERIAGCLIAAGESVRRGGASAGGIVVLVNNSTDATFDAAAAVLDRHETAYLLVAATLPPPVANAGGARRLALDLAASLTAATGTLLTTDADTIVGTSWVTANLAEIRRGAELVCGAIDIDPAEAAPILARMGNGYLFENEYLTLWNELAGRLDPHRHDGLPPHRTAGGASLAFRRRLYRDLDGMPILACGEDRAFVAAAHAQDRRVVHSAQARVTTSFRIDGRAAGGMADTLALRLGGDGALCDEIVEPAGRAALRLWARGQLRRCATAPSSSRREVFCALGFRDGDSLFEETRRFGEAWDRVERRSPRLGPALLSLRQVADEVPRLRRLVRSLRQGDAVPISAGDLERWLCRNHAKETARV